MKRNASFFLVLVLLALVPLRALASVAGGLCAAYAAEAAAAEHAAHHHGVSGGETSMPDDSGNGAPSICSLCTACCTGVTFVAEAPSAFVFAGAYRGLIPFFEHPTAAPHPDELDRPPLQS